MVEKLLALLITSILADPAYDILARMRQRKHFNKKDFNLHYHLKRGQHLARGVFLCRGVRSTIWKYPQCNYSS